MCLAQGPQRSDAGEVAAPRSRVKHSTTEPLRSLIRIVNSEEPDQGLHCLSSNLGLVTSVLNFRTYTVYNFGHGDGGRKVMGMKGAGYVFLFV